jgi:hypothetical protein
MALCAWLLTTPRPALPATGTVASRVRSFQNAAELRHSTASSRLPRIMTRAHEAGITVGRGRRLDSSFGSPAGRASRDGNEGLRGDGRPPVGTPMRAIHSSIETEIIRRPARLLVQRPATSLETTSKNVTGDNNVIPDLETLRKPRSLENLAPPQSAGNEISQARARLRSVKRPTASHSLPIEERNVRSDTTKQKKVPNQNSPDSHDILNELDGLLIGALRRVKTAAREDSAETAPNNALTSFRDQSTAPQPSLTYHNEARASLTAGMSRLHSTSRHRRNATNEPFTSNNNTGTDPQHYIKMPVDHESAGPPSKQEQDHLAVPTSLRKWPSPVKARAALFERVRYHVPGEYVPDRYNRDDNIITSSVSSMRKKLETENNAPRSTHIPQTEPALPELISHPRRHSQRSSGSGQSENGQCDTARESKSIDLPATQPRHDRKAPIAWPFKWNLFPQDKANPAPPKSSGVEAKAETGHDEHVMDTSMEHITSHMYVSPIKPALIPRRSLSQKRLVGGGTIGKGFTKEVSSVRERAKLFTGRQTANIAMPEDLHELHREGNPEEPRTPTKRAVLVPNQSTTPVKLETPQLKPPTASSPPRTPFRGRNRSALEEGYVAEQKYSLSRSRSRGGVKIVVEVTSPGPSPDRVTDETIVVIRANVQPLEE